MPKTIYLFLEQLPSTLRNSYTSYIRNLGLSYELCNYLYLDLLRLLMRFANLPKRILTHKNNPRGTIPQNLA